MFLAMQVLEIPVGGRRFPLVKIILLLGVGPGVNCDRQMVKNFS